MDKNVTTQLFSILLALGLSTFAHAQGITTPRTPRQTIGISTVTVQYARPAVKGREIWGALVP